MCVSAHVCMFCLCLVACVRVLSQGAWLESDSVSGSINNIKISCTRYSLCWHCLLYNTHKTSQQRFILKVWNKINHFIRHSGVSRHNILEELQLEDEQRLKSQETTGISIEHSMLPSYLPNRVAEKIQFIGQSVRMLKDTGSLKIQHYITKFGDILQG